MRWILLGALLGLLLLWPSLLTVLAAAVAWVISKPVIVAFALGLAARPHLPRMRRWAR
ncbi:hypothetical protein [Streptomyces liliifuscus]|uniref:Uncharacterized protein n=1 Tax=Streptomyces liliifuscus TaxID=2797636 RepID=A0A7T7I6M2_9ACTN|nr:hypothetical protein [Streptomyces liliifuscus]QQM41971.1 hypothetical protein JEQ17_22685 [Streptomyces liliifuscus]